MAVASSLEKRIALLGASEESYKVKNIVLRFMENAG